MRALAARVAPRARAAPPRSRRRLPSARAARAAARRLFLFARRLARPEPIQRRGDEPPRVRRVARDELDRTLRVEPSARVFAHAHRDRPRLGLACETPPRTTPLRPAAADAVGRGGIVGGSKAVRIRVEGDRAVDALG